MSSRMNVHFLSEKPHRRYNPLKDEWVLVSPQRTNRPWHGKQESHAVEKIPQYDPKCYLCPGNIRISGKKNLKYSDTYVFENDFQALENVIPSIHLNEDSNFTARTVKGECKVVCFSPRHDLTLAQMPLHKIESVIDTWIDQINTLKIHYDWVQIFENKGDIMGCSNPHPHGQVWASDFIPDEITKEDVQQSDYFKKKDSLLLLDYIQTELKIKERIVAENSSWVVVVPFWAIWPYETLLLPKFHRPQLLSITQKEKKGLTVIMKQLLMAYDKLFSVSMPYSMGWHFAPLNEKHDTYWQLHAHYYPPLLRSATVKKFMVGYEMLAEAQRDITPEQTAKQLRSLVG